MTSKFHLPPSQIAVTKRSRRCRRSRAWTAAGLAIALAVAPVSHPPLISKASAQTPTAPGELRKYGSVPKDPTPVPTLPDSGDIQKYGSIGGTAVPLSPGQKLPELGDSSQAMMSPAQERKL